MPQTRVRAVLYSGSSVVVVEHGSHGAKHDGSDGPSDFSGQGWYPSALRRLRGHHHVAECLFCLLFGPAFSCGSKSPLSLRSDVRSRRIRRGQNVTPLPVFLAEGGTSCVRLSESDNLSH